MCLDVFLRQSSERVLPYVRMTLCSRFFSSFFSFSKENSSSKSRSLQSFIVFLLNGILVYLPHNDSPSLKEEKERIKRINSSRTEGLYAIEETGRPVEEYQQGEHCSQVGEKHHQVHLISF